MLRGRVLAESLRVGTDLRIADLTVVRLGRHDVSTSTTPAVDPAPAGTDGDRGATASQPSIWTFVDFEAPDERADELAQALADVLIADQGWWADFRVGDDHVVVFAGRVFRYRVGDAVGRDEARAYGLAAGTPAHQLDWGD
jgi:hypothetical protein